MNRLFRFLSSLWLTVALLGFALLLVFFGTLAQVKFGLYAVQADYFRNFFIWWKPHGANWSLPVFPGGWLLGTLLLANLIAAHVKRFKFTRKKIGILLVHGGLILLLLGQFFTEVFQIESTMRMREGETRNFTEDSRRLELAVIDTSGANSNRVVSIPESLVAKGGEIQTPELPFKIRVKKYFENSRPTGPMESDSGILKATDGIGKRLGFAEANTTATMEDENKPAALVEIISDKGVIGEFTVTTWLTKYPWTEVLAGSVGGMLGNELNAPQTFTHDGRTYEIAYRPIRYYKPYEITLVDFTHDVYQGTDIPKNFSSKIRLEDTARGEDRNVLIYMNNPLRYGGETFFQSGFLPDNSGTILQVVKNPAAPTPYVSCSLVALGLVVQFLMHLVGFARRNKTKAATGSGRVAAKNANESLTAAGSGDRRNS